MKLLLNHIFWFVFFIVVLITNWMILDFIGWLVAWAYMLLTVAITLMALFMMRVAMTAKITNVTKTAPSVPDPYGPARSILAYLTFGVMFSNGYVTPALICLGISIFFSVAGPRMSKRIKERLAAVSPE